LPQVVAFSEEFSLILTALSTVAHKVICIAFTPTDENWKTSLKNQKTTTIPLPFTAISYHFDEALFCFI
jgi:hypothetical protein